MAFARIQRMAIAEREPEAGAVSVPLSFWTERAVPVSGSIETTPCAPSRALSERTAVRWAAVWPLVAAVLREAARRAGTRESKYGLAGAAWRLSARALGLTADAQAGTTSIVATVSPAATRDRGCNLLNLSFLLETETLCARGGLGGRSEAHPKRVLMP